MTLLASLVETPYGTMSLLGDRDTLRAASFTTDVDRLRERLPRELRGDHVVRQETSASRALRDYLDGDVGALATVAVSQPGGAFHSAVWKAMRAIPPGTTVSYSELAARAGRPRASRAAAAACARNAVCLFVPCHRVIRSDGTLGGYYFGLDTKRRLLAHEGVTDR